MSLFYQSFNYSSNINCCTNNHASQSQSRKNPSLVKLPPSVIPPFEGLEYQADSKRSPFSNKKSADKHISSSLTSQANAIGIIGGVSVDSALSFAKKLVYLNSQGEEDGLPFVLSSNPTLQKELLFLDSSSFPFRSGKTDRVQFDRSSIVENLRRKRIFLEKSAVSCIVMPCHISHSWHDEIAEGCSVPFLDMGECVAKELKEAKFRPLEAGSPLRIGVLATNESLVARFYSEKLENEGFEVVLLDKATMEHTVIPAVEALSREDFEGAQNLFRIALQVLLVKAVNRVVLASDELQGLLPSDDPLWRKCADPMDVLARSAVNCALSAGKVK